MDVLQHSWEEEIGKTIVEAESQLLWWKCNYVKPHEEKIESITEIQLIFELE